MSEPQETTTNQNTSLMILPPSCDHSALRISQAAITGSAPPMSRCNGDVGSQDSDASSTDLQSPHASSLGINPNGASRPASLTSLLSVESSFLHTPDSKPQEGSAHFIDTSASFRLDETDAGHESGEGNLLDQAESSSRSATPRAVTPAGSITPTGSVSQDEDLANVLMMANRPAPLAGDAIFRKKWFEERMKSESYMTYPRKHKGRCKLLGRDESADVTIWDTLGQDDLSILLPWPVSPTSTPSSPASIPGSPTSDSPAPAWAQPTQNTNLLVGTTQSLLETKLEEVIADFGEDILMHAPLDCKVSLLKSEEGRVAIKSTPDMHIICIWLPGHWSEMDNCTALLEGFQVFTVMANCHERDEHFSWRIPLPGAEYKVAAAEFLGPVLRIAVPRQGSPLALASAPIVTLESRGKIDVQKRKELVKQIVDPIGRSRTEAQLFAP